jgi:hypothetical protein
MGAITANRALGSKEVPQVVGIVSLITNQRSGCRNGGEQRTGTDEVVRLARRQSQGVEVSLAVCEGVDLGRASATRTADRLILLPPLAPAAERCARTTVLSIIATSGGSQAASAANSSCHSPRWLQRLNRLNSVVRGRTTREPRASADPRESDAECR